MITFVSDVMKKKLITITVEEGLCRAQRLMSENKIGCLPVLENGQLVGILTSRDIRDTHPNRIVADAMSSPVISITSTTSVWKAIHKLEKYSIERLLIVEDKELIGVVTKTQLLLEFGKHVDMLTGLYKSDYIFYKAEELLGKGLGLSIIFLDLNNFGYIDKEYGHTTGDIILKEFSKLISGNILDGTYLCRYGGDEFAILSNYNEEQCRILAENLVQIVKTHVFHEGINITVCAGIACIRQRASGEMNLTKIISDLINIASLASTRAKKEKVDFVVADNIAVPLIPETA